VYVYRYGIFIIDLWRIKMSKFNLKKHSVKTVVKPYEKRLDDNDKKVGIEQVENKIYDKLLHDDRKNEDDNRIYEKQLENARTYSPHKNTEGQFKDNEQKYHGAEGAPLMDMFKKTEQDEIDEFVKADNSDKREKRFWEGYVGTQIPKDQVTKIVDNDQPSQILSNFDNREEFRAENPAISPKVEEIMNSIKDADAMLYHIHRTAKSELRSLSEQEEKAIKEIDSGKTELLKALSVNLASTENNEDNTD